MAVAELAPIVAKIQSKAYWRVNIRPTMFIHNRIPDLSTCRDIIRSCDVSLRGWNYPHVGRNLSNGEDWIESETDWDDIIEYWRFYQSAQFVHLRACWEDYKATEMKVLELLNVLYTFTEIFEFAGRLAEKEILHPASEVSVRLFGMKGRRLTNSKLTLGFHWVYESKLGEIGFSGSYSEEELLARRDEIALDATVYVFERFNWELPNRQGLAEEQRKFLERRI